MTQELTVRFPWEPIPPAEAIEALRRDFAYAVGNTSVTVHSNNAAFIMSVNTARGQIVPRGEVVFSDGTKIELYDNGMCQPGLESMTVRDLMAHILALASELNLTVAKK